MRCLAGFVVLAMFCFFGSFLYLPLLLFSPGQFANFFTLGSLSTHFALAFMNQHPSDYLKKMLLRKDNTWFAVLYLCSVTGTLYVSWVWYSYIACVIFCGL